MNGLAGIFNTDTFTMETLTASINQIPFVPGRLGKLGIFDEAGVATTQIVIERQNSVLTLATTKARGAPGTSMTADKRNGVSIQVPHYPLEDALLADELQNVRSFGTSNQLRSVVEMRDQKLLKMSRTLDMTLEYQRLGAIQGIVLDADSSVIFNAFTAFNISAPTDIPLATSVPYNADVGSAPLSAAITVAKRQVRDALGGDSDAVDNVTGYWVACSDGFFDGLVNHGEVRATYLNQQAANEMRNSPTVGGTVDSFVYRGMTFENYRGIGAVKIPANKAVIVPIGVPELFITRFAPAPYFSAVNSIGLPKYVLATLDPTGEKRIDLEAQMNPISLCTRPEALQRFVLA